MEDKIVLILDALRESTRVEFSKLLRGFRDKTHGVMTFLAGLELTRRRILFLRQTRPFADLWMYRREEDPEDRNLEDEDKLGSVDEPGEHDMKQAEEGDALA